MSATSKEALIPIMTNQYAQILEMEEEWGIRLHEGDQRARIDYFHDAVRAFTSGEADIYAKDSRLSVEHLAYDLAQLRAAQANPLGERHNRSTQSPSTDLANTGEQPTHHRAKMDRQTKRVLSDLYRDYTVLFAALFAEVADMNFQSREDEIDQTISDIAQAEAAIKQLANGEISADQAKAIIDQMEYDALRQHLLNAISSQTIYHLQAEQIIAQLGQFETRLEADKKQIDKAHLNYVTSRLAVYENARDTIQNLAQQGMNLAGKFVESALSQQAGRGAGMGLNS